NCTGKALVGGGTCTVTVVFQPGAFGAVSGMFTVKAGNLAAAANLSGTGRDYVSLVVTLSGTGGGQGSGTGVSCNARTCTVKYPRTDAGAFQMVTLTAAPDAVSTFVGWNGNCGGTADCPLTMDADKSVGAVFNVKTIKITVNIVNLSGHTGRVHADDNSI